MRTIQHLFASFVLMGLTMSAHAAQGNPELGKEYSLLRQAQPVAAGKKIEVIEFFAYYCPHCHALEPVLADWVKKNSDKVDFKRVHVVMPGVESQFKLYYALDALGKVEGYHAKVFQAYHMERNRLMNDEQVGLFVSKVGLDKTSFFSAYNSFSVRMKLGNMEKMMANYEINSWPTIVVDGRYLTAPPMAAASMARVTEEQQNQALFPVLDSLVAKAQKEKIGNK